MSKVATKKVKIASIPQTQVEQETEMIDQEINQLTKEQQIKQQRIENLRKSREERQSQKQPIPVTKQIQKPANSILTSQATQMKPVQNSTDDQEEKASKKIRERWNPHCKIVTVSMPVKIAQDSNIKNRSHLIQFRYRDETGKLRDATVRFGSRNGKDFIESKKESDKSRNHSRWAGLSNPLDPNYWRYHICNTEESVVKAYSEYLIKNQFC